jgi:ATP-dependent DNA helicase RecG
MKAGDPVQYLKGAGPRRAEALAAAGFHTVEDFLYHLPLRYEDRRRISRVRDVRPGEEVTLVGRIGGVALVRTRKRRSILRALFEDDSGWVNLVWFHQAAYFKDRLTGGGSWLLHGRLEAGNRGGLQIVHPELEALEDEADAARMAGILPVYQKPGDIPVGVMRSMVAQAVAACAGGAKSVVPAALRRERGLMPLPEALRYVHAPPTDVDMEALEASATPAQRTLIYEELLTLQVGMQLRRAAREREEGLAMPRTPERLAAFLDVLPFAPTGAQQRVIQEISLDMERPRPMNRLVHGDVGSGKTVVAFAAVVQAVAAGRQAAVMAPTELLAEQHFASMAPWAEALGIDIRLLTGNLGARASREIRQAVASGHTDLVVGTHALVQDATEFARLGLAVVDEQHRFGVLQRARLKGTEADTLLLSATPIPRTLSLVLYGDLDVSFLDELPPGRKPVLTRVLRGEQRGRLHERMAEQIAAGRQCYIVYPLVEESEKVDLAAATSMAEELARGPFRDFRVGVLHGRMKAAEKDAVMRRFKAGELDVLVSTTVIEVGIDVPNATIMVVEHAERFGLSQLHQLRGRVGRGSEESFCMLVAERDAGPDAVERLRVMERTGDGFEVAEADLKLRGPGEYLGTRQSGAPTFRAANLVRDAELLEQARADADAWLARDPELAGAEAAELRRVLAERWGEKLRLAEVG